MQRRMRVLDPSVRAVPRVEVRQLSDTGVGGECGVAPAVPFLEHIELGARVGALPVDDHPRSGRVID